MIENLLKYFSLITVAGAGISFVVGLVKYLDQRNREERTKRFEIYHNLMRRISGPYGDETLPLTAQLAAIYELQHFPEYAYASKPILKHAREELARLNGPAVLLTAIDETLNALSCV